MLSPQRHLWLNPFRRKDPESATREAWRNTPLLMDIPATVCHKLVERTHLRHYQPGEYLFHEGEAGVSAAVIISGKIAIESGDHRIAELGPGAGLEIMTNLARLLVARLHRGNRSEAIDE